MSSLINLGETDVADPESAGMRTDRLEMIRAVLREEHSARAFPGAACLVARHGKPVFAHACGTLSPDSSSQVTLDTIFDMASVTKPMTTALMSLLLAETGRLSYLQTVPEFFPEHKLPHLEQITLRQLITHTSGLPAWRDLYTDTSSREQALELLLSTALTAAPGTRYEYSCLGYIILGFICERAAGCSLQDFLAREVWAPLGMTSTGFCPPEESRERIASTMHCPGRPGQELVGSVHDGNAWRLGGISGNAGLFSTVWDVFRFSRSILFPDTANPLLSRLALARYTTSQIDPAIGAHSFGWFCQGNGMLPAADFLPPDTFGHTGYTGTEVLISPSEELVVILLTNRVCTDPEASKIRRTRRRVANIVASAIA